MAAEIAAYADRHGPITIGLAGAGQMGTDIVVGVALMAGVSIGAVAEVRPQAAIDAAVMAGHAASDIVCAETAEGIDRAIERSKLAVTESYHALCTAAHIDVVIDATGNSNIGTLVALEAMRNGKHVVMLNVEADITVGRFLKEEARRAGVVYTGAAGDEPAATIELIGFAQSLGFEIVAAGKGKNNPLKFDATPEAYEAEARARNMNARMLVEFVDGSKTMVEMVAVANATGLVPDVPGMHGPAATREELAQVLATEADGGILSRTGVVDYSIGKGVAPGVFCIVKPRHGRVSER
ncbi:MAG: homoserine dehydrogenase, partial [Hyphomicrobiales bacterium]|nr:homoserine dehydrogenase [Hyphomicrobiales bacterium]